MPLPDKRKLAVNTQFRISLAVNAMRAGGVIAYPTEAVWGLGCDPFNQDAVLDLLQMKQRNWRKGVILVAANTAQLQAYLHGLDEKYLHAMFATWPGPNTWLVPDNGTAPDWISGGRNTLAVRVSAHPVVAALCEAFGGAIVSTSANPAGKPPARSLFSVKKYFGNNLDCIVPGALGGQKNPTQIRDVKTGDICRIG